MLEYLVSVSVFADMDLHPEDDFLQQLSNGLEVNPLLYHRDWLFCTVVKAGIK